MVPELSDLTGLETWTRYIQSLVSYTGDPDLISGFDFDAVATLTVADYLNLLDTAETFLLGFDWSILTAQIPFIENLLISQGVPAATISLALGFLNDFASGDVSLVTEGLDVIRAQLAGYAPETVLASAIAGDGKIDTGGGGGTPKGTSGNDELIGTAKADSLDGKGGNDDIDGRAGNDTLKGGSGNDTIDGGRGKDKINGGSGADEIDGGKSKDVIDGSKGNDTIKGGAGNDVIKGGSGKDVIEGEAGNDILRGNAGRDEFHFGKRDGDDTVKDFRNNVDTLVLDDSLWRGDLTKKQVMKRFGEQVDDDFVLTFKTGSITLEDFNGNGLGNDLEIV